MAQMAQVLKLWAYHCCHNSGIHVVSGLLFPFSVECPVANKCGADYRLSTQTTFWTQMLGEMDVTYADLTNAQAVQLVGLAVGCIFVIPLTKKYGRRSTYIFSTVTLAASCWWTTYMKTRVELYITSLLFGLAGAPNETVVQMSVRNLKQPDSVLPSISRRFSLTAKQITDLFFLHQRATANAVYFVAVTTGSFLTPMIAGYQASISGWRQSYFALAISLTVLSIVFIPLFEETKYTPVIENGIVDQRQQVEAHTIDLPLVTLENETPKAEAVEGCHHSDLHAVHIISDDGGLFQRPSNSWRQRIRLFTPTYEPILKTAYYPLFTICFPHVLFTAVQFSSAVCWLVVLSSMISIIFAAPPYNFDSAALSYMFAGPFIGTIFGSIYGGPLLDWAVVRFAKRNKGVFEAEMRLYLFPFQAVVTMVGLIIFGITADKASHSLRLITFISIQNLITTSRGCIGSIPA